MEPTKKDLADILPIEILDDDELAALASIMSDERIPEHIPSDEDWEDYERYLDNMDDMAELGLEPEDFG